MTNSVDPDQTPRSAASDLGLHCLLRSVYPNTRSKYVYPVMSLCQINSVHDKSRKIVPFRLCLRAFEVGYSLIIAYCASREKDSYAICFTGNEGPHESTYSIQYNTNNFISQCVLT